jgi:hypothetical protein
MENDSIFAVCSFHLEYEDGTLVDGETFSNLDRARDVAFDISQDESCSVVIRSSVGGCLFTEEVITDLFR